jgi:hypothetical protein
MTLKDKPTIGMRRMTWWRAVFAGPYFGLVDHVQTPRGVKRKRAQRARVLVSHYQVLPIVREIEIARALAPTVAAQVE